MHAPEFRVTYTSYEGLKRRCEMTSDGSHATVEMGIFLYEARPPQIRLVQVLIVGSGPELKDALAREGHERATGGQDP